MEEEEEAEGAAASSAANRYYYIIYTHDKMLIISIAKATAGRRWNFTVQGGIVLHLPSEHNWNLATYLKAICQWNQLAISTKPYTQTCMPLHMAQASCKLRNIEIPQGFLLKPAKSCDCRIRKWDDVIHFRAMSTALRYVCNLLNAASSTSAAPPH
jgi:hypothetical protein